MKVHLSILAWLLHHANRSSRSIEFYVVKDRILSQYGKQIGYDIQHIEGKKCFTCNGTGKYDRWDNYGIYDPDWCWHCCGNGYYKDPQWICLARIQFGNYVFHKPLKREKCIKNPFTDENMGWLVSDRPIIQGYVTHTRSAFSVYALLILFAFYNRKQFRVVLKSHIDDVIGSIGWKWYLFKKRFRKQPIVCHQYINAPDSDLPF